MFSLPIILFKNNFKNNIEKLFNSNIKNNLKLLNFPENVDEHVSMFIHIFSLVTVFLSLFSLKYNLIKKICTLLGSSGLIALSLFHMAGAGAVLGINKTILLVVSLHALFIPTLLKKILWIKKLFGKKSNNKCESSSDFECSTGSCNICDSTESSDNICNSTKKSSYNICDSSSSSSSSSSSISSSSCYSYSKTKGCFDQTRDDSSNLYKKNCYNLNKSKKSNKKSKKLNKNNIKKTIRSFKLN